MWALQPPAARSYSTRSLADSHSRSAERYIRRAAMRRRLRLSRKSSVSIPASRRLTGTRARLLRARRSSEARTSCETKPDYWVSQQCLAVVYGKLGRHADAEAELAKLKAALGDGAAYQYATIYAQWGDQAKALEWLETALRLRDPGLVVSEDRPADGSDTRRAEISKGDEGTALPVDRYLLSESPLIHPWRLRAKLPVSHGS